MRWRHMFADGCDGATETTLGRSASQRGLTRWAQALASWWAAGALIPTGHADATLVFNEIMYHPATREPELEWVELYNQLAVDLDVSGWQITGDIEYVFPPGTRAPGQGYLVVAVNPTALKAASGLDSLLGPFAGRLSNNGGTLELRNADARRMDRVQFETDGDWPVTPDGAGVSLAKQERDTASGPATNWTASTEIGGTPGSENFVPTAGPRPAITLIPASANWKAETSGTDLGSAWVQPAYPDADWTPVGGLERQPIPGLFSTGLSDTGTVLPPGTLDPHYLLTVAAQGPANTNATVCQPHPAWLPNSTASSWISVVANGEQSIAAGTYRYRTTFRLDSFLLDTVQLEFALAADNGATELLLNGISRPLNWTSFTSFSPVETLTQGFVPGTNTLEFIAYNEGGGENPAGFRAELKGSGLAPSGGAALPAGRPTLYLRHVFAFAGDPSLTSLTLDTLVTDGAVFYLNGRELWRSNLPDGPIAYSTPALSRVDTPAFSGPQTVSAADLIAGTNLLAVELHLATGNPGPPQFGLALTATQQPAPPVAVGFNELAGATNTLFALELINRGPDPLDLSGWTLRREGAADATYVFPESTRLDAGGFLGTTEGALQFRPVEGDRLFLLRRGGVGVVDGVKVATGSRARYPDGDGPWLRPSEPTYGAPNRVALRTEVVINEILYRAPALPSPHAPGVDTSPEQWLELYNRSDREVDLAGWELDGGIRHRFGPGDRLPPDAYLVVAWDPTTMRQWYPDRNITGGFAGRLSHRTDRLILKDPLGNPADQVQYFDGGRWPAWADGGGSSLELQDPWADNACGEAWAASDETRKTEWQSFRYRATASFPGGTQPTQWNDFILGLLDAGECLIDDLTVVEAPDTAPVALVNNGDFESGLAGWRTLGTHERSRVIPDPGNPANHVLHLVATGPQEHMHNHLETTLRNNRSVVNGRVYEVAFRARWLAGNPRLNSRLYFNRVARTTVLSVPARGGTPGAPNSRRLPNLGPTFAQLEHQPVVPSPQQPVTVSAVTTDPQGVATVTLWWSANGGTWRNTPCAAQASGRYSASIPAQPAGTVLQFHLEATDTLGASALYPAAGRNSGALYTVQDGQTNPQRGHNLRLLLSPAHRNLLHAFTNVMSNAELPGTVICDERRAYYDVGIRLKGSQRGRYSDTRVSFHLNFPPDDLFRGVHPVMLIDRSGAGDSTGNKQLEILIKHMLGRAGGIPGVPTDLCRVIAPRTTHTSSALLAPRLEDEFIETAYPDGGEGTLYEMELIYYPTTANAAGYKNPQPDDVLGVDLQNLGTDPEIYRYNFMIKNHRDTDDYRRFIAFASVLSLGDTELERQSPAVLDVDAWMRAWALVTLCGVGDSYTFGNDHNLMMFARPTDGRVVPFPVDMDFSFVRGTSDGLVGDRNLSRLIRRPQNLRVFYGHVLEIIEAAFNPSYMADWISHYNRFLPDQNFAWVADYIRQRAQYAAGVIQQAGGNAPFALNGPTTIATTTNLLTLSGTAPVQVQALRLNGAAWPVTWNSLSQWSLQIPLTSPTQHWVLEGVDARGRLLSNRTASVTVQYTGPTVDPAGWVLFNEVMPQPAQAEAGFVELFNASPTQTFDLTGWRVDGLDFTFPPGSLLRPRSYLTLAANPAAFALAYPAPIPPPLAGFAGVLRPEGEVLTLYRPAPDSDQEVLVDQIQYGSTAPWPVAANGTGASLQLVDPQQDNRRIANWAALEADQPAEPRWTRAIVQGTASSSLLYVYLTAAGDLFLDDLELVAGTQPGLGANLIRNGGFETPLADAWEVAPNHAGSTLSTTQKHSGASSLHLVASSGGSTRASALAQELSPPLAQDQPYTLSFWYRAGHQAAPLTLRLSGSGIATTVDAVPPVSLLATPGAENSVTRTLDPFPTVWLNEIQPLNLEGPADNTGEHEPWLELWNASLEPVLLEGLYLSTDPAQPLAWAFPQGATLAGGGFVTLWLDGEPQESTADHWHTDFRLPANGASVTLARPGNPNPEILDLLRPGPVPADAAYGSYPDGAPFQRRLLYRATPGATNSPALPPVTLWINEWMAANTRTSGIADPADQRYSDWFELFNPGPEPVRLDGWYLSDSLTNRTQYRIPTGYAVPAHGYLLVWADEEPGQNAPDRADLHVNFRLSQDGEALVLSDPSGLPVDTVVFGPQTDNVSQGRLPDGAPTLAFLPTPTPRGPNGPTEPPESPAFAQVLLTATDTVQLELRTTPGYRYRVEVAHNPEHGPWLPLGEPQRANTRTLTFTDSDRARPQRFYRAVLLP